MPSSGDILEAQDDSKAAETCVFQIQEQATVMGKVRTLKPLHPGVEVGSGIELGEVGWHRWASATSSAEWSNGAFIAAQL
ncbi:hypothetical protein P7K49_018588, partial [Saguinus oedipus]